jgi:RNA polymerase sigma-70 factor (ECF subfamily)
VLIEANRRLIEYVNAPSIPFHLWIRQIAKDRIIDAHRRHRLSAKRSVDREQAAIGQLSNDQSAMDLANQFQDQGLTPAAAATQRELAQHIERAILQLKEGDREVILMRHYEQLNNQEIAQTLGLSEPAASMRYLRAIKRLRELIESLPDLHKELRD